MSSKSKKKINVANVLPYIFLTIGAIVSLFPFYWMVSSSFKIDQEVLKYPPDLFPKHFSLDSYRYIWDNINLFRVFLNSIVVSAGISVLNLVLGAMMAYALTKLRFPGREALFVFLLVTMMIPFQLMMIPLFLICDEYHIMNSYLGLILPSVVNSFSIFLLRQAFKTIPNDFIDSARIDGSNHFRILFSVISPLAIPTILTVFIINFYSSWNSFLWPVLITTSDNMATMQVALSRFRTFQSERWGAIMSACTLTAIPIIILYLCIQRQFIESLALSGVKG